MAKQQEIMSYLNENCGLDKDKLLERLKKTFNLSSNTANQYYYKWKKEFMHSNDCVPTKEKKTETKVNKQLPKKTNKFDFDKVMNKAQEEVKTLEPKKKSELKIKTAVIQGEYGEYRLLEDGSVDAGEEIFKTAKDVEEYRSREIASFMAKLGEILDVMEMGAR